jgi:2-polyprenyl-3-methyl-5-hydroxy-6-metoxy-1,4-benzoquinol methylase
MSRMPDEVLNSPGGRLAAPPDEAGPVLSIGADVDIEELNREVRAAVWRKAEAGEYPPELAIDLQADPLVAAMDALAGAAEFAFDPPVGSPRRLTGQAVSAVKRLIRTALRWHTRWLVRQFYTFASNAVGTMTMLSDRLEEHAQELAQLRVELASAQARTRARLAAMDRRLAGHREPAVDHADPRSAGQRSSQVERELNYVEFENRFRGSREEVGRRQAVYVPLFKDAPGRVVDLGCGRGEFLEQLRQAGVEAYGVDQSADMVRVCGEHDLEARQGDVLAHLASLAEGSLGGVFCAQVLEHLDPAGVIRFFELAAAAIAPGGVLAVETLNPRSLAIFRNALYVDLGHTRPLHPMTLAFLAESAGFRQVGVRYLSPVPDQERLRQLPADAAPADPALASLLEVANANFQRLDEVLFGPQDFAVIARR